MAYFADRSIHNDNTVKACWIWYFLSFQGPFILSHPAPLHTLTYTHAHTHTNTLINYKFLLSIRKIQRFRKYKNITIVPTTLNILGIFTSNDFILEEMLQSWGEGSETRVSHKREDQISDPQDPNECHRGWVAWLLTCNPSPQRLRQALQKSCLARLAIQASSGLKWQSLSQWIRWNVTEKDSWYQLCVPYAFAKTLTCTNTHMNAHYTHMHE